MELLTNLIKSRIAECQGTDPEAVQHLESAQEKIKLYEKTMLGDETSLMLCSLHSGIITQEQYQDFIEIKKRCGSNNEHEACSYGSIR